MERPLRTLGHIKNFRRATEGRLGAAMVAICDNPKCGMRFRVPVVEAVRELGAEATGDDLKGELNCPHCQGGKAATTYITVDDKPRVDRQSIYFSGQFANSLDNIDVFATEKPRRPPRR